MDSIQIAAPPGKGSGLARYRYAYTGMNAVSRKADLFFTNTLSSVAAIHALTQLMTSLSIDTRRETTLLTDRGAGKTNTGSSLSSKLSYSCSSFFSLLLRREETHRGETNLFPLLLFRVSVKTLPRARKENQHLLLQLCQL